MRHDMDRAEQHRRAELDRQESARQRDMYEFRSMFRLLSANMNQTGDRTTQGPTTTGRDKGKGLLVNPNYQTDNEADPNNVSHIGSSAEGANKNKMGPPPDRTQQEMYDEYRTPNRVQRFANSSQNRTYYDSEGEEGESPHRQRRRERNPPWQEERRTPTVCYEFPKFNGEHLREWLFMAK